MSATTCSRSPASRTPAWTSSTSPSGPQSACPRKRAGNWEWSSPSFVQVRLFRTFGASGALANFELRPFGPRRAYRAGLARVDASHAGPDLGTNRDAIESLVPVPGLLALLARAAWPVRFCRRAQGAAEHLE